MSATEIVQLISVLCSAVLAGTIVCVMAVFVPMVGRFPDPEALRIRQAMNPLIDRYQRPLGVIATVAGVAVLFFGLSTAQYVCTAVGIAGAVGVALISARFNFPINDTMDTWSLEAVPPEFRPLQKQWNRYHLFRTLAALTALAGFAVSPLVS